MTTENRGRIGPYAAKLRVVKWAGGSEVRLGLGIVWGWGGAYDDIRRWEAAVYLIWWKIGFVFRRPRAAVIVSSGAFREAVRTAEHALEHQA